MNKTAHTKSANVFLAVGDLLRTLRGVGGLGKVEQALTNPVAMGRRSAVGNIGKAVAAPVLAPALGVMGVASKVDRAAKAHDPLRLLQMRSREAAVKGMSNRPVDRRQFVTDMMRGMLNPDVRQAVGTLGTAAVRGAASLAEKIASMEKTANRLTDLLRAGKLGKGSLQRLGMPELALPSVAQTSHNLRAAVHQNLSPVLQDAFGPQAPGLWRLYNGARKYERGTDISPAQLFKLQETAGVAPLQELRFNLRGTPPHPLLSAANKSTKDLRDTQILPPKIKLLASRKDNQGGDWARRGNFDSADSYFEALGPHYIHRGRASHRVAGPRARVVVSGGAIDPGAPARPGIMGVLAHELGHQKENLEPQFSNYLRRRLSTMLLPTMRPVSGSLAEVPGELVGHLRAAGLPASLGGMQAKRLPIAHMLEKDREGLMATRDFLRQQYPGMSNGLLGRVLSARAHVASNYSVPFQRPGSMLKSAAEHDGLSVSEGVVNPLRIGADSFVGYKALKGAARTLLNPSEMYHGTSTEHLPGIIRDGLKPHNNVAKWVALKAEEIGRLQDALRRNGVPENSIQRDVADELTRLEKIKQNLSTPKTFLSKGFFGGRTEAKSYAESAAHAAPGSQGVVLSTTLTPDELRRAVPDVITSRSGAWNKPDIHNFSVDWTIPSRRVYKGTPSLWGLIRGRSPEILKNLKANGAFRAAFGLGALGVAGLAGLDAVRTGKRTADKLTQEKSAALTPFERLGGIAAPMEKEAGVPTGLLRSFLRGQKPLFHAMSGENAKGLLKMPRALTSTEAIERGLASNIESGAGFGRGGAPTRASIIRPTLGDGSATISVPELVASNAKEKLGYLSGDLLDYAPTRALAKLRMPNHALQSGAASELASQLNTGASKNWGNISFSEGAPFRGYGEFGIMTTPSRVTGGQTKSLWSPVWEGKEVQARPNWIPGASGVPETLQLPSAPGKIFYHPSVDNAPMVRQLHAQYGRQNVIPWNSRTKRQMLNMG